MRLGGHPVGCAVLVDVESGCGGRLDRELISQVDDSSRGYFVATVFPVGVKFTNLFLVLAADTVPLRVPSILNRTGVYAGAAVLEADARNSRLSSGSRLRKSYHGRPQRRTTALMSLDSRTELFVVVGQVVVVVVVVVVERRPVV